MINFRKIYIANGSLLFLIPVFVFAQTPPGVNITLTSLLDTAKSIAGFLIAAGGILVAITIIGTGIMYFMSGGNQQKVAGAKSMFKAGIIGALIIFAPGLIIGTISGFTTNPFGFFGGGGSTTGTGGGGGGGIITYGCNSSNACVQMAGGIFIDSTCAGQCGAQITSQAISTACYNCTNQGGVWCFDTSTCDPDVFNCPGTFTRLSGNCP